ncbi:MAG: YfcE family phosphodiesterase [Candidatus Falkowbacteria bacterium]
MKIVIFSDLHDNIPNLDILLTWISSNKITKLVFCGDMAHFETLEYLRHKFSGELFLVGGNADSFYAKDVRKLKKINYDEQRLEFKIENQKILITHKPADLKKYLAENSSYDFAFHGHTHKPWMAKENGLIIANPGTLSEVFSKSSFALLDTKTGKLELKILEKTL